MEVVIAVPVYKKEFSEDDLISLGILSKNLGKYKIVTIQPKSLNVTINNWPSIYFEDFFFSSRENYSKLLLSREFYKSFSDYDYLLIYQLDSLVLSDQLPLWMSKGLDYVGPLWVRQDIEKWEAVEWNYVAEGVGNGGFSLRKVRTAIDILNTMVSKICIEGKSCQVIEDFEMVQKYSREILKDKIFSGNEDMFWGLVVETFVTDFKKATIEEALAFGFEYEPEKCFKRNNSILPFGTHAWNRYPQNRVFWIKKLKEKFDLDEVIRSVVVK